MTKFSGRFLFASLAPCLFALCWFTACSSTPKVNWDNRVGNFTHDQAVAEMGPPDKSAPLGDGTTVAEWFLRRGSSVSVGVGTGFYSGGGSVGVGQSVGTSPSGVYLRLTFGPDGKLVKWQRLRR
ncbi:MAG TPA: hypothetical protein VJW76_07610 [Verrucomicrobiae bacterium]|nr:hypothetical protein [Verrucomicrobiae bacterium]